MDSQSEELSDARKLTPQENIKIMKWLVADWNLGPKTGIDNNQGNSIFWHKIATKWGIDAKSARRRSCANCDYGNIDPEYLKAMEHVPYNSFDKDGGMRVWCDKFSFICHATRVCQAWEDED